MANLNSWDKTSGVPSTLTTGELDSMISYIRNGELSGMNDILEKFSESRPESAILPLQRIALLQEPVDEKHQAAAIMALSKIGGPNAVQALVKIKAPPENIWYVCGALGTICEDGGLPYLFDILNNGVMFPTGYNQDPERRNKIRILTHAYAIEAVRAINNPRIIPQLISSTTGTLFSQDLFSLRYDATPNLEAIMVAALVTNRDGEIETLMSLSHETARIWLYQNYRKVIVSLGKKNGTDQILSCYPLALVGIQRLIVALSLIDLGITDRYVFDTLSQSTKSSDTAERILANDGFITAASMYHQHNFIEWGKMALADRNGFIHIAAAGSAIYNIEPTLTPMALKFLTSQAWEERFALLFPLQSLAIKGDKNAKKILSDMAQRDQNDTIRGWALRLFEELPMKQALYFVEVSKAQVRNGLQKAIDNLEVLANEPSEEFDDTPANGFVPAQSLANSDKAPTNSDPVKPPPVPAKPALDRSISQSAPALNIEPTSTTPVQTIRFCGQCGTAILPGNPFCTQCGCRLPEEPTLAEEWICGGCQAVVPADAVNCPSCGAILVEEETDQADLPISSPAPDSAEEWFCYQCQAVVDADAVRCPACGVSLEEDDETGPSSLPFSYPLPERPDSAEEWVCYQCQAVVDADAVLCPACGVSLEEDDETGASSLPISYPLPVQPDSAEEWVCYQCQAVVDADAVRCPACGVSLEEDEEIEQAALPTPVAVPEPPGLPLRPAFCMMCGKKVPALGIYCPHCGSKLEL